jgi:WXG100 family type VII secretion target
MADFELKIDPAGLTTAAGKYGDASTKFSTTVGELQGALKSALSVWEDSSNEAWDARVTKACEDLTAINDLLQGNSNALTEIADFATQSEQTVNTGISSL